MGDLSILVQQPSTVNHGACLIRLNWKIQPDWLKPDVKQKGVDLRIGLDIARLSLLHLVDVIVVVTGDSDMVPAFKFARREGLRIYLDHMKHGVRRELKAHADLVL
ncbi:MAG: NYN domain-containing protein [Candidatus Eisenbacteria bacterium]|uniref:NYN domain-containing protein n=1 Tax=Eiseniibacteriota bacterium TaxID=2212470 RepID=A0A948W865_UNCEI|nr:NYN domain-containing protein [Candidatus Eisenbacteria bacterium]MBU1949116.1 NYN domain-containing protein [Candidatus Eisenbacteria bacterium]MBU2692381.1 NYN domain-containing protein [Candidatus Eisenbacteria bacterium]